MAILLEGGVDKLRAEWPAGALQEEAATLTPQADLRGTIPGPTAAMAGTFYAPLTFTGYQSLPQFSGINQGAYWLRPGAVVIRDVGGAHDLLAFGHSLTGVDGNLHLATSQDRAATWAWTASASSMGVGTVGDGDGVEYAAQDSSGNVHLTFKSASGSVYYLRLTLTRDGSGHVTGYSGLTSGLDLTSLSGPNGGSFRGSVHVFRDGTSVERLVVAVGGDGANSGQYVWVAVADSLTPAALSNFKDLSGTASTMSLALNQTTAGGGIYDHAYGIAQVGSSKDLAVFCAPVIAEAAPTVATDLVWARLTTSGSTWTVGSTTTYAVSGGCWFGGACSTDNYAWVTVADYNTGNIRVLRMNSSGTLADAGWGTPSVPAFGVGVTCHLTGNIHADEQRGWFALSRDSTGNTGGWGTEHYSTYYFNGSSWTANTSEASTARGVQANAQAFAYGLGGLVDPQFDGIVAMQSNCQGTSFSGVLAAIAYTGGSLVQTVSGTLAGTLAGPTTAIAGTVSGGSTVTATLAGTLAGPTTSIAAGEGVAGSISGTLAGPTTSIGGARGEAASLSGTLAGPTTSIGASSTTGAIAGTIPGPTTSIGAARGVDGYIFGSLVAGALPGPSTAMAGAHGVAAGLAGTIPGPTTTIAATVSGSTVTATLAGTLPGPATAIAGSSTTGALAGTIPGPSTAATAAHGVAGALAGTLGGPTAAVGAAHGVAGSLAGTIPGPTVQITGTAAAAGLVVAALAGTIPGPVAALAGSSVAGSVAGALPGPSTSIGAQEGAQAALGGTLAGPTTSIAGTVSTPGLVSASLAGTIPGPTALIGAASQGIAVPWARWTFETDNFSQVFDSTGRVGPLGVRSDGTWPTRIPRNTTSLGWQFQGNGTTAPSGIAGDGLSVADFISFVSGEWTVAFWMRRGSTAAANGTILDVTHLAEAGSALSRARILYTQSSGQFVVQHFRRTGLATAVAGSTTWAALITDFNWHHIVARKRIPGGDLVSGVPVYDVWLDGVQVAATTLNSQPNVYPQAWPTPLGGRVGIGQSYGGSGGAPLHALGLDGSLDNLTLYNFACSDGEAAQLYADALGVLATLAGVIAGPTVSIGAFFGVQVPALLIVRYTVPPEARTLYVAGESRRHTPEPEERTLYVD